MITHVYMHQRHMKKFGKLTLLIDCTSIESIKLESQPLDAASPSGVNTAGALASVSSPVVFAGTS